MPDRNRAVDHFRHERRKIRDSGIVDALIQFVEGKRDMSSSQVSAALGLLKKAVPDLSAATFVERDGTPAEEHEGISAIEFRIVDPRS